MLTIKVRLYRSHDYDLIVLAQTGIISIATVGKKALEACFKGEEYVVDIKDITKPVPDKKSNMLITRVQVSDEDCPGIEHWFNGFLVGARNNMVKCLIRKALSDVPVWAYRTDGWISAEAEAKEVQKVLDSISKNENKESPKIEKKEKAPKKEKPKKEAVEEQAAKEKMPEIKKEEKEKITPISKAQTSVYEPDIKEPENIEGEEDEDFDAFEAFSALQK